LPGVDTLCENGSNGCFALLLQQLKQRRTEAGCSHLAIAIDAYVTVTEHLIAARNDGRFDRPDRLNHEAYQYAHEFLRQYDKWVSPNPLTKASVSPSWKVAFKAMEDRTQTGTGDLLLWLNAHIRRDNTIRAIDQTEGVLRIQGMMPEASGRPDHDTVSDVLAETLAPMLAHNAQYYDQTVDDAPELWGIVFDPEGLYTPISSWREEAWQNAQQLRHARANGGVNGLLYQTKLAQIETLALGGAEIIKLATLATPQQTADRLAHCQANIGDIN
jgi:hypothetical protein